MQTAMQGIWKARERINMQKEIYIIVLKGNERKCKVMKGEKIQFAFLSAE